MRLGCWRRLVPPSRRSRGDRIPTVSFDSSLRTILKCPGRNPLFATVTPPEETGREVPTVGRLSRVASSEPHTPGAVPVHASKVITLPMESVITLLWNG